MSKIAFNEKFAKNCKLSYDYGYSYLYCNYQLHKYFTENNATQSDIQTITDGSYECDSEEKNENYDFSQHVSSSVPTINGCSIHILY